MNNRGRIASADMKSKDEREQEEEKLKKGKEKQKQVNGKNRIVRKLQFDCQEEMLRFSDMRGGMKTEE